MFTLNTEGARWWVRMMKWTRRGKDFQAEKVEREKYMVVEEEYAQVITATHFMIRKILECGTSKIIGQQRIELPLMPGMEQAFEKKLYHHAVIMANPDPEPEDEEENICG